MPVVAPPRRPYPYFTTTPYAGVPIGSLVSPAGGILYPGHIPANIIPGAGGRPAYQPKPAAGVQGAATGGVPGVGIGDTSAPIGSYDPNLDALQRNARLGLADLTAKLGQAGTESASDYMLAQQQLQQRQKQGMQDIDRRYERLGYSQTLAARRMGVDEGSTPKVSARIRGRLQGREESRLRSTIDRALGDLALRAQRASQDRAQQLATASRDATLYGQDIEASKWWQAGASMAPQTLAQLLAGLAPTNLPRKR